MPVLDPRAGYAAIWFVSCSLFISVASGGIFLVMYMILPESDSPYWLPFAGVALVCFPWFFWLCTCFYRIISRILGIRVSVGGAGGASRGINIASSNQGAGNNYDNCGELPGINHQSNNNIDQIGGSDNGQERKEESVRSRESETPLASSVET